MSSILFNLVMDDVLQEDKYGSSVFDEDRIMGMGFADDLILFSSTQATHEALLNRVTPLLSARGLDINTDKTFTLSQAPDAASKETKVIGDSEFRIGEHVLRAAKISS